MKVKIQNRSVYHKFGEIEIEIPKDIREEDIHEYLLDNEHLYANKIDKAISKSNLEYGSGVNDYRGMDDESDSEWRFECEQLKIGGHL
tara:strand:- start:803 stop:1066 length:264 start_codon:yes stop_codon:yes gene_type:complete